MKLTVIGCAGSFPSADSAGSCYVVEHDGYRLVLDIGNGALMGLQRHLDLNDAASIHGVVISHHHADHVADLESLRVLRNYQPAGALPLLPVISSRSDLGTGFEVMPHKKQQHMGPFIIQSAEMVHPVRCHAVRIEADGCSITYSGDTGINDRLVELAANTDVALFEASWTDAPDRPRDLHMSGREAGQLARRAQAKHLVLTHIVPWHRADLIESEAREAFDGPITMAEPDLIFEW